MRLAGGWTIHHLSDRCIELRKDSYEYRRLTGRDGFVRIRAEPGMDRKDVVELALKQAQDSDTALAFRVANELIPTARNAERYVATTRQLAQRFATPEEPELIGVKKA